MKVSRYIGALVLLAYCSLAAGNVFLCVNEAGHFCLESAPCESECVEGDAGQDPGVGSSESECLNCVDMAFTDRLLSPTRTLVNGPVLVALAGSPADSSFGLPLSPTPSREPVREPDAAALSLRSTVLLI